MYRLYQRYINFNSINPWPCGPSSASGVNDSKPEEAVNIYIHYITGNIAIYERVQSVKNCSGVVEVLPGQP